jgi:MarR family
VSGSELARRAGVSGPAVSQLIAGLADSGLLVREFAEDRRRQTLTLTAHGQEALRSARALLRERLSSLLADLPRPEADALTRAPAGRRDTVGRATAPAPRAHAATATAHTPGEAAETVTVPPHIGRISARRSPDSGRGGLRGRRSSRAGSRRGRGAMPDKPRSRSGEGG